jgi:hypothetical protein
VLNVGRLFGRLEKSGGDDHRAHALAPQHLPFPVDLESRTIAVSS